MALINCLGCGARISDKALACPKCGWTNKSETGSVNAEEARDEKELKAEKEELKTAEEQLKAVEEVKASAERKAAEELKASQNKTERLNAQGKHDAGLAASRGAERKPPVPKGKGYDPGLERSRDQGRKRIDNSDRRIMQIFSGLGIGVLVLITFVALANKNTDSQFLRECTTSYGYEEDFSNKCINYLRDLVGGRRKYKKLMKWVSNNLSEREINAFNNAIDSGNAADIQRRILKLNQKYLRSLED